MTALSKKLYKGKKRLAKRFLRGGDQRILLWALSVKPGDYIATCEGVNRKVAEVEPEWINEGWWCRSKPNKTRILREVRFTDTRGRWHHCPGGGCAYPAQTPEEVTDYWRDYAFDEREEDRIRHWYGKDEERIQKALAYQARLRGALEDGQPIVDEHGEFLPEFEANPWAM